MRAWWLAVAVLAACGGTEPDGDTDAVDTDAAEDSGTNVDLVRACILETWFVQTCTGCHAGNNHLSMTSDPLGTLRDTRRETDPSAPLLIAGDADNSLLVRKLLARAGALELGPGEGDPMPPDRTITLEEAERVAAWVESGAPDCP